MRRVFIIVVTIYCIFVACVCFANPADAYTSSEGGYIGSFGHFNDIIDHPWEQIDSYGFQSLEDFNTGVNISSDAFAQIKALGDGYVKNSGYAGPDGSLLVTIHYPWAAAPDGSDVGMDVTYSHLANVSVHTGEKVSKGETVAFVGKGEGNFEESSYVHIEVNYGNSGQSVDPALYFKDFKPGAAVPHEGGNGQGAAVYRSPPINFELKADMVNSVRSIFEEIIKAATTGLHLIEGGAKKLFIILISIDLAFALGFYLIDQSMSERTGILSYITFKLLFYGFLLFFLTHWGEFVGNFSRNLFTETAAIMSSRTQAEIAAAISSPTDIMAKGLNIVSPIISQLLKDSGSSLGLGLGFAFVIGFLILFLFIVIGWHIALAYIEFYMMVLFSFTTFVFAGEKHTRIHSENGINGIIASAINLMFFCFFAIILQSTMADLSVDSIFTTETKAGQEIAYHPIPAQPGEAYSPQGEGVTWVRQTGDVSYNGAQPQTLQAMDILGQWFYAQTGHPLVITAVTNGDSHQDGERGHYAGWKIDVNDWGSGAEGTLLGEAEGTKGTLADEFIRFGQSIGLGMNWEFDHIDISVLGDQWEGPYAGTSFGGLNGATAGTSQIHRVPAVRTLVNMQVLLKLFLAVLMFMMVGDRIRKAVMNSFGSRGFTFRMNS